MKVAYRETKTYKYQVMRNFEFKTDIKGLEIKVGNFLRLFKSGKLLIKVGYAWDGPSGPTIDTNTFMKGSLVHDALYQMMRSGKLNIKWRNYADELLGKICIKDGMTSVRAWYVVKAVKLFGKGSAIPQKETPKTKYAP